MTTPLHRNQACVGAALWSQVALGGVLGAAVPTLVPTLHDYKIVQAAAGDEHTLFLADGGAVLSVGRGDVGQLGVAVTEGVDGVPATHFPKVVAALQGVSVRQVACGAEHSLVLSDSGEVYGFGSFDHGQLGRKPKSMRRPVDAFKPIRVAGLSRTRIIQVRATTCWAFSLLCVYWSVARSCGVVCVRTVCERGRACMLRCMNVQVAAGTEHTVLLSDIGSVLTFGNGSFGRLGHGSTQSFAQATVVSAFDAMREVIVMVAAGTHASC